MTLATIFLWLGLACLVGGALILATVALDEFAAWLEHRSSQRFRDGMDAVPRRIRS